MSQQVNKRIASKFTELRQVYVKNLVWRIGREGNIIFVCYPDLSTSYWVFIGTVDEIVSLSVSELENHLRDLNHKRCMIPFPPSQWEGGIGEAEIEKHDGRRITKR